MPNWSNEELGKKLTENPELSPCPPSLDKGNPLPMLASLLTKKHKYNAERTSGFASRKEYNYARQLELRKQAHEIDFWLKQVRLPLPGQTEYRVDFVIFTQVANTALYELHWIEVKGYKVRLGEIKRKQAEELYNIVVEVV